MPSPNWEARVIFSGERDRDGDYALKDLAVAPRSPFHGRATSRDTPTATSAHHVARRGGGERLVTRSTGFVKWETEDATDLDYTPLPLATRDNDEDALQFTQEVRLASGAERPDPAAATRRR